MFEFSGEQIDAFSIESEKNFGNILYQELIQIYPEIFSGLTPHLQQMMVLNGITRAEKYGFTQRDTISIFVHLMAQITPDFDQNPEILGVLQGSNIEEEDKINQIILLLERDDIAEYLHENGRITAWLEVGQSEA